MTRVLVVGGGPSGSTAAAMLAKYGASVQLIEKSEFPRPHIGESLQPASLGLLDHHFNLAPTLAKASFARKYGAVYVWGDTRVPWSVLFDESLDVKLETITETDLLKGDYLHAWQVERSQFDQILLNNAKSQGVQVFEGAEVLDCEWSGQKITKVQIRCSNQEVITITPDWVVDASGQRCLTGRQLRTIQTIEDLRATATYGYFHGAGGLPGPLARHVQYVVSIPMGWVWFIPICENWTSIGVVSQTTQILSEKGFQDLTHDALSGISLGEWRPRHGSKLHHARDWSYINRKVNGENWLAVGDAFAFIDPILSGGVDFGIRSGLNGAIAIAQALNGDDSSLNRYASQHQKEIRSYLRMARYWYGNNRSVDGFFWAARSEISDTSISTPTRAFVYLTSGQYAADTHFKVFSQAQEQRIFEALGVQREMLRTSISKKRETLSDG